MENYTKLYKSLITSTVWQENHTTRILWITMLALSDAEGMVEGSIPGLARLAGITTEECVDGLERLSSPDKYSRTQEHEGRRIKAANGGWIILNRGKYRDKPNSRAEYYRRWRQNKKNNKSATKSVARNTNDTQIEEEVEEEVNNNININDKKNRTIFDNARKKYPGAKRGIDPEWDYFVSICKKYKLNISKTVANIVIGVDNLINYRTKVQKNNAVGGNTFLPPPKHFKTWIYNQCWTEEFPEISEPKTQAQILAEKREAYEKKKNE